jgi:hypothetical protein
MSKAFPRTTKISSNNLRSSRIPFSNESKVERKIESRRQKSKIMEREDIEQANR